MLALQAALLIFGAVCLVLAAVAVAALHLLDGR
jgi:hypothetical protein